MSPIQSGKQTSVKQLGMLTPFIFILASGADVYIENIFGYTALAYAIRGEFWDVAAVLRKAGKLFNTIGRS